MSVSTAASTAVLPPSSLACKPILEASLANLDSRIDMVSTPSPQSPLKAAKEQQIIQGQTEPPIKTLEDKAKAAALILNRYRIEYENDWDTPLSIINAESLILDFLKRNEPIELILPAFPFKSSNKSKKVLGTFPDEAERVSLQHLNGLCESIKDATDGDCRLKIISDGISYNDLLGVTDDEVWTYGWALRQMAKDYECDNIEFCRIYELLNKREYKELGSLDSVSYLKRVPEFREELERFCPEDYDVKEQISVDSDVAQTYRGYKKFLQTECEDSRKPRSQSDRENAQIAKQMLRRGKAFANAIKAAYPRSVRLSIHPSTDTTKISITMLPQENPVKMTPWHGAVIRSIDGTITMAHAHTVSALTHEVIYINDRPSYFRERSDLFEWNGKDLVFEYQYPTGIIVRPRQHDPSRFALCTVDMQKVRALSELCTPVVLRGFTHTKDRHSFIAKAYDVGEVQPWYFGIVREIKDEANTDSGGDSAQSTEAMPMHYDGIFKMVKVTNEVTGKEEEIAMPPRFQYFVSQAVAEKGSGYTLFASSPCFWKHLPKAYSLKKLSKVRWTSRSYGYYQHDLSSLPLVVDHPSLGTPCLRWLQPWPRWRTAYNSHYIEIENGSQKLIDLIDSFSYDRRVCLYFQWEEGDVVLADNIVSLHTRTAFTGSGRRELWRIHID